MELVTRGSGDYQKTIKKLQTQIKVNKKVKSAHKSLPLFTKVGTKFLSLKKIPPFISHSSLQSLILQELQALLDDETRARDESRDAINRAERRANELAVQLDESRVALEQTERQRKLGETEKNEHVDRLAELQAM